MRVLVDMALKDRYYINGIMRRNSVSISPQPQREEEDRKFNLNELIAVVSSEEDDLEQEECNSSIKQGVSSCISNIQPVIQSVNPINTGVPGRNALEQRSIFQDCQPSDRQPNDRQPSDHQPNSNLPYDALLKTVSALAETVKSLKNNFENFENARNSKKKHKKRSRKHYSSDSTSGDSSSSSSSSVERRRKRRRHRHKSSRSHRKRYDSSSECSSERDYRKYHRHCYHCCKYEENITKPNQNQVTVPQISAPIRNQNNTLPVKETPQHRIVYSRKKNELQSQQNEPSTSHQNGLQAKRRNSIRQSCSERKIVETDDSDGTLSENSSSFSKRPRKPILRPQATVSFKRRNSIAANGGATQDIFRPPNTNKSLYFASRNASTCQICKKSVARIVSHYKRFHENSEVYVSRISKKMVDKAENGLHGAKKSPKLSGRIKAICFFCEEKKEFAPSYWFDHYRSHTGEYGFKCDVCDVMYSIGRDCCKRAASKIFDDDLYSSDFVAFICEICNFVQVDEATVRKHLRVEHDDVADTQYHEITLLPSMRKINKRSIMFIPVLPFSFSQPQIILK
ncbi:uncharacterized protein LOC129566770 [Sitodiplosis mosellana]|uniref:uncharacterized protein LOC129566770 n=1 Tax=Sitodiplosis mosellana TaxID=263140 RepID=UPI0024438E53|nr:uncharacterized protein LOC129566770 [Sitodiplosis mosellana]